MRLPKELKEFDFMKQEKIRRINNANNLPKNGFVRLEKLFFGLISASLKTLEAIVSIYLGIILIPTLAALWLINEIVRVLIISPLLNFKFGKGKYKLVSSAEDNIWSFRKPLNSRNLLTLSVYKSNPNSFESSLLSSCPQINVHAYGQNFLKNVINYVDKKKRKPYEKLKWILAQRLGYCVWEKTADDPNETNNKPVNKSGHDQLIPKKIFDINEHVRILNTEKILDKDFVAESDLQQILYELAQDMTTMDRPQWETVIIPKFVYDCDVAQYELAKRSKVGEGGEGSDNIYQFVRTVTIFRFHHGYMDANSALSIMTKLHEVENGGSSERVSILDLDPLAPLKLNRWKTLCQFFYLLTFGTWKLIRAVCAEMYADSRFITPRFKGVIHHAWSDFIKMEDLEKIRKKTGAGTDTTITEIFICALGAALRAVSMKFCKKPPWLIFPDTLEGSCFIGLVRALLPYPREGPINNFGIVGFDIDTTPVGGKEDNDWAVTTRLQRFELARKLYKEQIQASPLIILNHGLQTFVGRFPTFVIQYLFRDTGCPVIFNNIPWIQAKLKLKGQENVMSGEKELELEEFATFIPLLTSTGLVITTAKYKDKMRFCAATEAACLSSQELKYFLNAMRDEIMSMLNECDDNTSADSDGNNIISGTSAHRNNRPRSSYNNRTKVHCS